MGTKLMQVGAEKGRESSQKEGRGVGCGFRAGEGQVSITPTLPLGDQVCLLPV